MLRTILFWEVSWLQSKKFNAQNENKAYTAQLELEVWLSKASMLACLSSKFYCITSEDPLVLKYLYSPE